MTRVAASCVTNAQSKEIVVPSPIVTKYGSEPKFASPTIETFLPKFGRPYFSEGINMLYL